MITVTFSAFLQLREKLKAKGLRPSNVDMRLEEGSTVEALVLKAGLAPREVEGAFVNGKIHSLDTVLHDGDRVALVPPGTPGPHRMLMGIYQGSKDRTRNPHR